MTTRQKRKGGDGAAKSDAGTRTRETTAPIGTAGQTVRTVRTTRPKAPEVAADVTSVGQLVRDPHNRRKHNTRNIGMVVSALKDVGAARSIVIDEDNVVLAGNGVTEAAAEAGISRVRVIDAEGDEIIAVRRRGLTPEQKRNLAIYDNRAGELSEWNEEQLAADKAAGLDFAPWFTPSELKGVLPKATEETRSTAPQLGALEYRVVVDCRDEQHQAELLARFEAEELPCRALTS